MSCVVGFHCWHLHVRCNVVVLEYIDLPIFPLSLLQLPEKHWSPWTPSVKIPNISSRPLELAICVLHQPTPVVRIHVFCCWYFWLPTVQKIHPKRKTTNNYDKKCPHKTLRNTNNGRISYWMKTLNPSSKRRCLTFYSWTAAYSKDGTADNRPDTPTKQRIAIFQVLFFHHCRCNCFS